MMAVRIVRDKDIHGGDPVIQGTRWNTSIVRSFDYDVAVIHDQYPHLSIGQIEAAIRFERSWHRRLERAWRQRLGAWIAGEES